MVDPSPAPDLPRHPVRLVAQRTGLSPHVLRVWERRYSAVRPKRSAGGQRLYSDADIDRLALLHEATRAGRNIGALVPLANAELEQLIESDRQASGSAPGEPSRAGANGTAAAPIALERALAAVRAWDPGRIEAELRRAASTLDIDLFCDAVAVRFLEAIGDQWARGELGPAQEHLASGLVRQVLEDVLRACAPPSGAPALIVGTLPGQLHDLGAVLAAVAAAARGWKVTVLGADLPASEIARAAEAVGARVVGVSLIHPRADAAGRAALGDLVDRLPAGRRLVLGGAAAPSYRSTFAAKPGVTFVESLAAFRVLLEQLTPA